MVVTQAGSSPPRGQYTMVTGVCLDRLPGFILRN